MKKLIPIIALAAALASCSGQKGWKVEGNLANAPEGAKIAVESYNAGLWYNLDSVEVKPNGQFAYAAPAAADFADVHRLGYNGKYIYFPIDSAETVTVSTDANAFDANFTLEGTPAAAQMAAIENKIAGLIAAKGPEAVLADSVLKRELSETILNDSTGIIAYYIINKTVAGKPLYTADNRADIAIFGAIANKFNTLFPNDPRTQYLAARYLMARREAGMSTPVTIEATETSLLDVDLYDPKGNLRSLAETVNDAGITLLSFTAYETEPSLPYNVELNRLYELFAPQKLAIYQISFDTDEVAWRESAANLPWTTVHNNAGEKYLLLYNVGVIPTTFIINGKGEIAERVVDLNDLEAAIRRNL